MRRLHIWFLFCFGLLIAIPTLGLGVNAARILLAGAISADGEMSSGTKIPERVDEFIQTHFGFRQDLVEMNGDLKTYFSSQSPRVVWGADEWLFITDNDVFSQITGQRVDVEAVGRLAAVMQRLNEDSLGKGRALVVAIAPEKHTIYRHKLPRWARVTAARTELDVLLGQMREAAVNAVDLRPVLLSRVADRPVYWRGDTHWTEFGAALAFNQIVSALGLPQQRIDVDASYGPEQSMSRKGDLVGLMAIKGDWLEIHKPPIDPQMLSLEAYDRTVLRKVGRYETFRLRHKSSPADIASRPKVLVIGDSFSETFFPPLFMRFASEYVWAQRRVTNVDQAFIDEIDPDIIVFETVERTINLFR